MNRTVKVRIAVAVDTDGDWRSAGQNGWDDDIAMSMSGGSEYLISPAWYWVEAELPVPSGVAVQGSVEAAS